MSSRLRVLLITLEDCSDIKSWSGLPYFLRRSLESRVELLVVDRLPTTRRVDEVLKRAVLGQDKYPLWISSGSMRKYGSLARDAVQKYNPDVLLSISSAPLALAGALGVPTFMLSDAPWAVYKDAYAEWEDKWPLLSSKFIERESAVARSVTGCVFMSDWAKQQAVRVYQVAPEKVASIPAGANFLTPPSRRDVLSAVNTRSLDEIRLLFVGKDWERKGGPLVLETLNHLTSRGVRVHLDIVGAAPAIPFSMSHSTTVHGFLDKSNSSDALILERLWKESTFLFVPTRAEAYGLVFAEAQAYGIPVIGRDVYGLGSVVVNGFTGILLSPDAGPHQFADAIAGVSHWQYREMAAAAQQRFERLLNWDAFGNSLTSFMRERSASWRPL